MYSKPPKVLAFQACGFTSRRQLAYILQWDLKNTDGCAACRTRTLSLSLSISCVTDPFFLDIYFDVVDSCDVINYGNSRLIMLAIAKKYGLYM